MNQQIVNCKDNSPSMSEVIQMYLHLKLNKKPHSFATGATRNVDYLTEAIGNKPIASYTIIDAGKFRNWLIAKGMITSSLKCVLSRIKAIVNLTISENDLHMKNPFANVFLPDIGSGTKRLPVPSRDITTIQNTCMSIDDEIRWLIELTSYKKLRLSDAVGLL